MRQSVDIVRADGPSRGAPAGSRGEASASIKLRSSSLRWAAPPIPRRTSTPWRTTSSRRTPSG